MVKYLDIAIANDTINTIDIKGKSYSEVNQRIKVFRMLYPKGTIETEMLSNENGVCVFKASAYDENGYLLATGTAYEKEDSSFINKTSYIENCETSAVGRALGMCGIGIDVSVASAEEVQNAMANQTVTQEEADTYKLDFGKFNGKTIKEVMEIKPEYIEWLMSNTQNERILKIIELTTGLVVPSEEEQQSNLTKITKVMELVRETETDLENMLKAFKVNDLTKMNDKQLDLAIKKLEEKLGE